MNISSAETGTLPSNDEPGREKQKIYVRPKRIYRSTYDDVNSVQYFFQGILNGNITFEVTCPTGTPPLTTMYSGGNMSFATLNETFARIAHSMMAYGRNTGSSAFDRAAKGAVFAMDTCVHVEWLWVIYPTVLIAAMLLFFTQRSCM